MSGRGSVSGRLLLRCSLVYRDGLWGAGADGLCARQSFVRRMIMPRLCVCGWAR